MKPVRPWMVTIAALLALVGCSLTQAGRRKENDGDDKAAMVIGGSGAGSVANKQSILTIRIASRPVEDEALGSILWDAADEQIIPTAVRHALEVNGLRLGVLTGELPKEVHEVLDAPPPKRIDPMTIVLPDGESTVVNLASAMGRTLSLGAESAAGVVKKHYADLGGFYRVVAKLGDAGGVTLRLIPELHHGPFRRNWVAGPTIGSMEPMQFVIRDGQTEETLTDLKAEVVLRPGQVAVLAGRPEAKGGLGEFLFAGFEGNSDRAVRKVLFLSATRPDLGSTPGTRAIPPRLIPDAIPEETAAPTANPPGR